MLADAHGNVIHLGERDCTIQRRHQKLVEETPSPAVGARAARADRRRSPSTPRAPPATARRERSRGCSRPDGDYFFMEMNTRIQVEHTVTELVTGLDLIREQVLVAAGAAAVAAPGGRRPARPRDRVPHQRRGSLARLPAEPRDGSRATASRRGPGVRVDSGVARGLGDQRPLRPDDREADRARHGSRDGAPADAARARRVRDRRREVAARLPPGAARASVLRRGRDVPRARRVRGAGASRRSEFSHRDSDGSRRGGRIVAQATRRQWPKWTGAASR